MPQMVMPRNWTVRTNRGHIVRFRKGEPVNVPQDQFVIEECMKFGAEFVNKADMVLEDEDAPDPTAPKTPAERKQRIVTLFKDMIKNQTQYRDHFTAQGRPNTPWVANYLKIDIAAAEVEAIWTELVKPKVED